MFLDSRLKQEEFFLDHRLHRGRNAGLLCSTRVRLHDAGALSPDPRLHVRALARLGPELSTQTSVEKVLDYQKTEANKQVVAHRSVGEIRLSTNAKGTSYRQAPEDLGQHVILTCPKRLFLPG